MKLFKPVVTRLALAATSRLQDDAVCRETGMIIDTPGVISQGKGGYDLISHIVSEFAGEFVIWERGLFERRVWTNGIGS